MSINYFDLFILIVLIVSVYFGYKKGFLKTITGVISIILSVVIAITAYPTMEEMIRKTPVYDYVYENVSSRLETPDENTNKISEYGAGKLNLPKEFLKNMQKKAYETQDDISDSIATSTADSAVKIVSMLTVFFAARILLFIVLAIAQLIKKLPVIGWSDRILGVVFGIVRGILIIYIILAVVTVSAQLKSDNFLARAVKQSEIAKIMYNNNVFLDFVHND